MAQRLKTKLVKYLCELSRLKPDDLLDQWDEKFGKIGPFVEASGMV